MSRATLRRRLMKLVLAPSALLPGPSETEEVREILRVRLVGGPPVTGQDFPTFTEAEFAAMPDFHRNLLAPLNE